MKISKYKVRIILFFVCMGIFSLIFQISASIPPNEDEAISFVEEFSESMSQMDGIGIFVHNAKITLPMFIPGGGFAWGVYSAWELGFAFASLTSMNPELGNVPPLAILFISPFGLMELVAYSIAISRSIMLLTSIIQKKIFINLNKKITIEVGIVLGLLFVGGQLEMYLLELAEQGINFMPQFN